MARPLVRLFVDAPLGPGLPVTLADAASHYISTVMRVTEGQLTELFNGRDGVFAARLTDAHRKRCQLVCERLVAPQEIPPDVWLCAALLKKARIDWTAEKCCELGAARFVPVITRRTIVDRPNRDRLRAHMVEAAEQCGRSFVPPVDEPVSLSQLLANLGQDRRLVFLDEAGGAPALAALLTARSWTGGWALLIGPEGGFDDAEREQLIQHPQALRLSLGPRILRADTAAAAALSLWQATLGDWGNRLSRA
jgi:16S rRNA (uracil1498-N3)-methyltransferase